MNKHIIYSRGRAYFLYSIFIMFSITGWADDFQDIQRYLQEFHANPERMVDRLPQEIVNGQAIDKGFINHKNTTQFGAKRKMHKDLADSFGLFSQPLSNDSAASLVDGGRVSANIQYLDTLTSASLATTPWADSYWPTHKGLIGIRYADPSFPNSKTFQENYDYIYTYPAGNIVASGDPYAINNLSPAEKYDLLMGDGNWTMTNYAWAQGRLYLSREGVVPSWVGICHGWAAAAHMDAPVTQRPIVAKSVYGYSITFYPSDIKALQSMLWANASPGAKFVGKKCNVSWPAKDSVGRVLDPDCQDNNPATFHLVMTNQLGVNHRSFIMDGTYDLEVWNFPLVSYTFKYFNPQTMQPTMDFRYAIVPIEQFSVDKFRSYRSPYARYVIGIAMDDTYVIEIVPNHNSQQGNPTKTVRHIYDLELDANYNVIGGEWYSDAHPDFIWTYDLGSQARSTADGNLNPGDWRPGNAVPAHWTGSAQVASARGEPLLTVINGLLAHERVQ